MPLSDLQCLLDFVGELSEVDTIGVGPLICMIDEAEVLREDIAENTITKQVATEEQPPIGQRYFMGPGIMH